MNTLNIDLSSFSPSEKETIEANTQKFLVRSQNESWYSFGEGNFIIPHEEFLILYQNNPAFRNILLLKNKIQEILVNKDVLSYLKQQTSHFSKNDTVSENNTASQDGTTQNSPNEMTGAAFGLMLSLTSNCSLRCSYCYISGGDEKKSMSWEIAQKATDYSVRYCLEQKIKNFSLTFHGQGEPTLNWNLLKKASEYYKKQCIEHGFVPQIMLMTNGVLSKQKIVFLKENNVEAGISMDCSSETLDKLRPMANGKSLLYILNNTLKMFDELEYNFGIRATVTDLNVDEMEDFVHYLSQFKACTSVKFEPVAMSGRAFNSTLKDDFSDRFILNFFKAKRAALRNGLTVTHAASQLDSQRTAFCKAIGNNLNFCVSASGAVSSCYEHLKDTDDNNPFVYGKYTNGNFSISENKRLELKKKNPLAAECESCFISTTCCGDCHSKCFSKEEKNQKKCYINREIAKIDLYFLSLSKLENPKN